MVHIHFHASKAPWGEAPAGAPKTMLLRARGTETPGDLFDGAVGTIFVGRTRLGGNVRILTTVVSILKTRDGRMWHWDIPFDFSPRAASSVIDQETAILGVQDQELPFSWENELRILRELQEEKLGELWQWFMDMRAVEDDQPRAEAPPWLFRIRRPINESKVIFFGDHHTEHTIPASLEWHDVEMFARNDAPGARIIANTSGILGLRDTQKAHSTSIVFRLAVGEVTMVGPILLNESEERFLRIAEKETILMRTPGLTKERAKRIKTSMNLARAHAGRFDLFLRYLRTEPLQETFTTSDTHGFLYFSEEKPPRLDWRLLGPGQTEYIPTDSRIQQVFITSTNGRPSTLALVIPRVELRKDRESGIPHGVLASIRCKETHHLSKVVAIAFPANGEMICRTIPFRSWRQAHRCIRDMETRIVRSFAEEDERDPQEIAALIMDQLTNKLQRLLARRRTSITALRWTIAGMRWLTSTERREFIAERARREAARRAGGRTPATL